jgi:hypothetical protein
MRVGLREPLGLERSNLYRKMRSLGITPAINQIWHNGVNMPLLRKTFQRLLLPVLCFDLLLGAAEPPRKIRETDLYAFQWIANAQISPDGSKIAYVRVSVTPKHDNYDTELWLVESQGGTPRQITSGCGIRIRAGRRNGRRSRFCARPKKTASPLRRRSICSLSQVGKRSN